MAGLPLPGEIAGRAAGVGEDCGNGISVRPDRLSDKDAVEFELPPNAKVLIDNPATHASAYVPTAKDLRNSLGIIPSSGIWLNIRRALARNAGMTNIQSAHRTKRGFSPVVKVNAAFASIRSGRLFTHRPFTRSRLASN